MKRITILILTTILSLNVFSSLLKNVPIDLKQPDGIIIHCFISGDEFHHRVHDKDNYTIIQNPQTGYYVYAILIGSELTSSNYIVGKVDPQTLLIKPGYDISASEITKQAIPKLKSTQVNPVYPTKGNLNNIVISIRFSDQSPTTLTLQDYENKFNSTTNLSLKSYYKEVSNSQLNVSSCFFPKPQNQTIIEYQDSHPRAYYSLYNVSTNPIGYVNDGTQREQTLLNNAIQFVASQITESQINYDSNNDGFFDNIIFVMQGDVDNWGNILWPKTSSLIYSQVFIGTKQVHMYNIQLTSWLDIGVVCHEFFHSIGAPDLYRYTNKDIDPVGAWDLMGSNLGEHMTTYMKWKYGKWLDSIPVIKQPGIYTLKPVSQLANACYKIPSPDNPDEYFVVEYRKKEGLLESTFPSNYNDGLIVYRINTQVARGNSSGPPDELYIYRPNGDLFQNGDISKASFSANSNRTAINKETNPSAFLSTGESGWIDISNITSAGNDINFTVNLVHPLPKPQNLTATNQNSQVFLKWNQPVKSSQTLLGYNAFLWGNNTPLNSVLITDTTFMTPIPGQSAVYAFKVIAKYQQGTSDPSICNFINFSTPSILDSLALVTLYNKCNGTNWTRQNNWLRGPLSTWEGVVVENGRVVKLALGDERPSIGVKGQLPDELLNLTEIRYISFWQNQLTGTLPESWSTLKNLEVLSLSINKFEGTLPKSWSKLVNLKRLEVLGNRITGTLPEEWSALVNLENLWLNDNLLTGTLPECWSSLTKLQLLWFSYNKLSGTLPKSWSSLVNLHDLTLYNNQFTGSLPEEWSSMVNMQQLGLSNNNFIGPVPASWTSMVNMIWFTIFNNHLTSFPDISSWKKLNYLELTANNLDFGDIEPNIGTPKNSFYYFPQAKVGIADTIYKNPGEEFRISVKVGGKSNNYQWYKNDRIITGAIGTEYVIPSITSQDVGVYTCTITNTVVPNLYLYSQPITLKVVNHQPTANAGSDQTVNAGTLVTLDGTASTDPDGDQLSYKWTAPAGITLSSNSIDKPRFTVPLVNVTTVYTFTLVVNDGVIDSPVDQVIITVNGVPSAAGTITGNNIVCKGGTETYSVEPITGATSYIWTLPIGVTGTSSINTINVTVVTNAASGNIKVKGHNNRGDGTESILAFTVNSYPGGAGVITGNDNICQVTTNVMYSVPPITGATSYIWTLPTGATGTSTANSISLNYGSNSASGTLKVKGHNDCGDGTESSLPIAVCLGVGVEDAALSNKVEIFPNPTQNVFYVTINKSFKYDYQVEVINSFGQTKQRILKNKTITKFSMDLTNYPKGLYFLKFSDKETNFNCKILKQ